MASSTERPTEDEQVSLGIDDLQISLQAEQEHTQKKTFTCWINSQLAKHPCPSVVSDLFTDIKKGHVLLDLLEVLSGQQLPRDKGSNTFQCRINIEHALTFLKNRSIKLINIHVTDIIDGNPSIILGLIWTIILHFHIEELAQTLSCNYNQPSLDCVSEVDSSPTSSPPAKKCSKAQARWQISAKKALLLWAQEQCAAYESVSVTDFKSSWRNGMAFLAIIHALRPDLIDLNSVKHRSNRDNLEEAFRIAERELKIPKLLEPEDVDVTNPDEKSIMTYVAQFLKYSKDVPGTGEETQGKVKDAGVWLTLQEEKLQKALKDSENESYFKMYESLLSFLKSFNEEKKPFLDILLMQKNLDELSEDQLQLRRAWDGLNHQINAWKAKLNHALPSPLHQIEAWLQEIENLLDEDLPASLDYTEARTQTQEKITLFKSLVDKSDCHLNTLLAFENRDEKHLLLVPPSKLEEMKRRINNILGKKCIPCLEIHYPMCPVLGLLDEMRSKFDVWNIKYGSKESVELLLEDWHKFIEEKEFLAQLEASFQKCEEMNQNLAGDYQTISKQYMTVDYNICIYRKYIYTVKSTLEKVLACWTTYMEHLRLLKACFEDTKKEKVKEVPFETLSQWNLEHTTLNEVGDFLIEVSDDEVGSSISKELRRLNKRWRKFVTKTPLEMNLPLMKKQSQPVLDTAGNIQLTKEEKSTIGFSTDMSIKPPENHNPDLKAGEEHEKENEELTEKLKLVEEVEKLVGQVGIWEAETKSVLGLVRHQNDVDTSVEESLQHLIAKGSMYEELMARTEDTLQMDVQNISSQESLQHILTVGLQAKIQEAKEKIQINIIQLVAVLKNPTDVSPELDVRLKVEELQKELESYITRAEQLLAQRESHSGLISKYKEALIIFNSVSLAQYLKAVEELKNNVTEDVKLSLEERSRDVCAKWESLHHELSLYIQQLKIDIEKGKLTENISKLEKQINKEKKLIRRGKTKGLIKEHEACFSEEGNLYQLDHHIEVLRELCEELTSQKSQQEMKRVLKDYEQRIERLRKSASEIHMTLQPMAGGMSKKKGTVNTSENGGRDVHSEVPFAKSDNQPSTEKATEPVKNFSLESELEPQHEEDMEKNEKDYSASINSLLERYDTHREILELHLQNNKCRITSDFSSDKEMSSDCLQDTLTDLQVLKNETDAYWKEFEITSLKLENLVSDIQKPVIAKTRDILKGKERELQMTLSARMESMATALQIVLPVEKASLVLCNSDLLLHEIPIQEFHLTDAGSIYQNLKNIQDSIAKQIEICDNLEKSGNFALKELHPFDLHATQSIILKCKAQLEEMNHKVHRSEGTLKNLEDFLASLRTAELSIEPMTDLLASDTQVLPENTSTIENEEGKIHLMKDKARRLDKHLKMLDISFKDAEWGEDSSCEKLIDVLSAKFGVYEEPTEENKLLEICVLKNNELLKNIQDVQNQISKIGLKDPSIPAVKQRKKSLIRVDKDLDEYEEEKKHLQEMANSLPQFKDGREKTLNQQCQDTVLLWENTKASVAECLEQCERVLELLKQYQNFKNVLTTLIQKEENVISLQASYMGKENLKKRITEIEIVKEEFNEHLEDVDKINQICKNLQFHLNKMRTFEEPPFEKEANVIVDRWLDINEKTEDYYENLGRALALWDKLFTLKDVIDEWIQKVHQRLELHALTEVEREGLKEELWVQEQKLPEFFARVAEIQFLLQTSEVPLELQVMESSILNKMEHVKMGLTGESNRCTLSGNTDELREDLDQAKTQIGMTESLLNALSPSDSLEIFTKLEEIQQQILQQKHSMILLENQIGCMTPELSELKKQYESVSDLFNTKKSVLQDHFSNLLNDQCKNFNDWFSNIKMNLKECFDSSETRKNVEQKLQKLSDFLTLEERDSKIQQVGTVLNQVKKHLPKANVKELSSWITNQEFELENMESICQAQAKELDDCLQQLQRLQENHRNLSSWLTNQEKKWKEMKESREKAELFCQALDRKREQFESLAQLNNSLKEYGLTEEEIIAESTHLIDKYQTLLRQLCEIEEEEKLLPTKDQSFNDLADDVIHWITEIKESLMVLNSPEVKMPLEERIKKIKEIILLKPEGDAKIQTITKQAESGKPPMVQKTLDIRNEWDNTLHLANKYLSHQEKLLLEGEKYLQSKEDLRLILTDLKKKQEAGLALQNGLQEKKSQLKKYEKFLQKAQDLTSLLKGSKSEGNYLLECTKNPNLSEDPWLEIKQLHESLLQQLQDSVQKLEGHVQEHDTYQVCVTDLNATLDNFCKELDSFSDKPVDQVAVEEKLKKLQELENKLSLQDGTLEKILALAESVKQNTSSVGQKIIKDHITSLKCKQKDLVNGLESAKQETENCLNSILKSKYSTEKKEEFTLPGGEKQVTCDMLESTQNLAAVEKLEEVGEINKNSAVEMVLSKQLSLRLEDSMKNAEDEQKVNELQNQPLELDIMLRNEQLKEIEKLYTQLEAKKAAIQPLEQTEHLNQIEASALVPQNTRYSVHKLDHLLQVLTTLKKNKESQYCLLKDFQEHFAAVESSMKALLAEKESLKVGALDIATYLDKIKNFLASIEKEKDSLCKLRIKWENVSNPLTDMDKKLLESQIKQLEHGWEQAEQLIQKKYAQQVVEYDEFNLLMSKIQDIEISLQQQQQCLQFRLRSPEQQEGNQSLVSLATELEAIKHRFSLLKGRADLQMKRIWGEKEKKTLEDVISNLQKQLDALEPLNLEVKNQIKKCEIKNEMKETILWAKNLLGEFIHTVSLLPDDILSQIRRCKVMQDGILEKQPVLESLAEEVKGNVTHLSADEANDLNNLLQDLQNQHQMLILESAQRSQQLEFKLEEKSKFFTAMEKVQLSLQGNETLIIPKLETTPTESELGNQLVTLKTSQEELQETESVISTYLQELANFSKDVSVFEKLFLTDQLKNLKTRANRTQRLIQNKSDEVEHKINFYKEFHDKISRLQKEVDNIQHSELLLNQEINQDVKEEFCNFKDRLTVIQSSILQILKLKEVFDYIGLNWDCAQLDQLQTQVFEKQKEIEEKIKQLDSFVAEHGKYQASLRKMRAMDAKIKEKAEAVLKSFSTSPESSLLSAQILNQKIEKAMCLYHEIIKKLIENKAFDESFKEKEILQIKQYTEENDKLHQVLQNLVLELQPKEMDEKNFQDKLENSLHVLNQIKSQLQQPLLINLEIKHIQNEKDNCEAFQEQIQAEVFSIKAVTVIGKQSEKEHASEASEVETKLRDFEDLQTQLNASIVLHTNALNDAYENMTRYNEAVTRALGITTALEAVLASHRVDLDNPEESLEMPRWKQEEFESTIADIRDLSEKLGAISNPETRLRLEYTLQELSSKDSTMREAARIGEAEMERCLEDYKCYSKIKEKICTNFSEVEKVLGQSMSQLPLSYKEALEHSEQSKALVSNLLSTKEELMKLRQVLSRLRPLCTEKDGMCLLGTVSALWEKWLRLLEAAKEWETWCEELRREWKFVSEEIEREAIILDNLQEELPEISKTKEAATTEELSELLDCLCQYEENVEKQQLLLTLLFQRIKSIQNVPEDLSPMETVPAFQEIASMKERCIQLFQKVQKNKELVQTEIQGRHSVKKEIMALKNLFQRTSFQVMELQDHPEKTEQLQELQSILKKEKLTFEDIMEKLRIKYSEMYTIVPAEIESQMEECRKALEDVEEKISNEVLKSSPSYAMSQKIEEINGGLHNVEKMLQQKSKNIEKAQEIQKKMWDELDLWHSKLNELDSEVQDIVEQDPGQAQEWMDNLMIPFQQYQQVSQRAETRTSQLNKATIKMEEYNDLLKSTEAWIENTSRLLANHADYDSSRTPSQHAVALQMALEDSEQKYNLLYSVFSDLEDLSIIFETDDLAQSVQQLSSQVTALQQKIMESLPQIQRMADDVVAIETEVKSMEKRVLKIKAILLSKEIFDFSPEEHLKHGEVVLENIRPMKKTIAEIVSYQVGLRSPQTGIKSLPVFQRTNQLLQDIKLLENVAQEENELLKIVIKQINECDEEIENLKEILNNYSAEFSLERMSPDQAVSLPQVQGEISNMEAQILSLNQKKEDLLVHLKAAVLNLHQHLKQEHELEKEMPSAAAPEEGGVAEGDVSEWELSRTGSMSLLPAVMEEMEESSVKSENGDKKAEASSSSWSLLRVHDEDTEEDRASLSSRTIIQGATPPIEAAALGFPGKQRAFEATVEKTRPEPAEVLHVCKTQVAELEQWLDQANVAFEPETLNAGMQQVVEQQLVGCQAMLTEIEHKVASLLDSCKDQGLGDSGDTQQEAEALSLKLKTVKCNLEKFQMMLQEKYSEDQYSTIVKKPSGHKKILQDNLPAFVSIVTERPQFSRQKDFQQQQVLELKPVEQKDLIKFIEFNVTKMWPQYSQQDKETTQESSLSDKASSPQDDAPDAAFSAQGQSGDKWQYLQHELSSKIQLPSSQLVAPQVVTNMSILPSVGVYNFRYPTIEELQTYTVQLEDLRQEANNLQTQENVTEVTYINLDKKLFELLLALSQCLSNVEEMLQTPALCRGDVHTQQVHYEALALELKKLYLAMSDKKGEILKAMTCPGKNTNLFLECFDNLQVCLEHTQATAASQSKSLKAGLDYNCSYQNEVKQLYDQLTKNKTSLQQSLNEISSQRIDEQLQKTDAYTMELLNSESRVAKLRDEGERLHLPYGLLQEVYKLEDVLDSMWEVLRSRYSELSHPFITEIQQDALLQGMVELVHIGREKLARDHLQQTKSKVALQAQIQDHKVFFQKLVADMFLIQTYSNKMIPSLLQKKEAFWAEQVKEVKLLEEKSHEHGMKLQSLLQKWEDFDENYASLEKELEILISTLPSVSLVEETEERLMERISFYQQIKRNIDEKHARLYQTLNEGKQLVASVSCPQVEGQISKLEEQWLSLNKKIDHELHRLQTLLKHLVSYNKDSDELTEWLESSQQTLNYWKEQSLNVSQDLDTIRSNINTFFDFLKEVDKKSSLKTAVISTGNQLLHLKEADTATLRASLAQFEQKWTMLITQLPDIQEKLHQLQMEKLPSRKAITEMIRWMTSVEHQTADEDSVLSPSSASQVKNLLHKYKEFRMEMDYKQWIVDFVNQSLLQLSTCDVESKRYERTEFAEHLGEMNRQWHRLHGTLNRKIQHFEQLLESITDNENKIQILNNWMEVQEERLKTLQKPGSVISVQKTLLDCQDIENQLAIKSKALDELRQSSLTLESGTMPLLEDTASAIDDLFQKRNSVINQVNQLKTSMQSVLQEWKIYDKLFDEVNMMTVRFWYCLEHSKPVVLSLEALRCQVQTLQALQDEAESSEGSWEKLQEVIGKLKNSCPSVAEIIEEKCQDTYTRWTQVNQAISDELQKAQSLLQLWKAYGSAHAEATARLEQQEAKYQQLASISMSGNNLAEILTPALHDIKELQHDVQKTKEALLQNAALLERLPTSAESSPDVLLSGQSHSLQRASYLEKMLLVKGNEFEFVLSQFKDFEDHLESLKGLIMHEEENLDKLYQQEKEENFDSILNHVLALTAQSPDIERLNEVSLKLPLSDIAVKTLQNMNRQWIRATATALERSSELQGIGLNEKFLYCCEKWVQLLDKIEEMLKVNMASNLQALLEQQKSYAMLEAEVSINQTIADSFVTQSLQLLNTAEVEKRPEFVSKFTMLKDQWQSAAQRVHQRKGDIDVLVRQWQYFSASVEDLLRFLTDTSHLLSVVRSQDCYSLYQTRSLIHEFKNKEIYFRRRQTAYALTLEAGEKLLSVTDLETKESIDKKIRQLQDSWKGTELQVGEMIKHFQSLVETWDQCEKKIKELKSRLQALKAKSKDPLPELHEDLHKEKELIKELEKSLANWTENLRELHTMKADLTQHILVEDVMVLKEQIEHLHRQWEDLCLRVAMRKQEIEDRLNSWIVFNEKNKDLCAWLVQMENKVLQTADISIEEMIEKLQKDCMEEINTFSENKFQLKQMGDQLIQASNKTRAAEINDKLNKINDRWQHLFDVIGSRVKKLKETFAFIQQLDKNMSNLRTWLARIESELSKPVVYDVCDDQEIQKRLAEQQDLQRDIEQHSAGVESVFNICDVLLHDSDACANETECDSIQQTTRSLDRRWRNICAMSMERRMKIEETWRLWQKFLDDYSRFEDWLKSAERTAAYPNSSEVLYTSAKEELKRFEAFQRQIHERLTQLELINKQYRRLARENRTDTASKLKQMVHEGNQRWDNLQKRVTAVLRRLRHFTNQREEFEGTRESILVWLTEMDLQLTNVEHFSESDADDKMRQLNGFQQEITLNTNKIDQLIVFGEQLIQKSEPLDAVLIEDELEELHRYCQEVFGRVSRFHRRLTSRTPGMEDEKEASENETDMEDSREIQSDSWRKRGENEEAASPQSLCHLVPLAPGHERSGCETPVSVDSIPLEWDHTGDVGGSSSHEEDEEGPYYSALSDVEIPENPEAYLKMTTKTLKASSGKSISDGHSWHVPDSPSHPKRHYKQMEGDRNVPPIPSDSSTPYKPAYAKLLLPPGTDGGNEGPRVLDSRPQQEEEGLAGLTVQQTGAFDRWELIQAQELHNKLRIKQNLQQLNSDISDISAWLRNTEAELETLKTAAAPSDIQEMELRVKRLKEILKAFDTYKALMVTVHESSKESLQTESAESKELQNRLHQLSLHWEAAQGAVDSWREGLRQSLMQCQDFHQLSQSLLLWLASAENRRQKAHVTDPKADPQALLECQKALMQLEKELLECQPQVDSLQEISTSLLIKGHGDDYIEAEEKVHVIGKKLKQLLEQVSQDLMSLQRSQNLDPSLPGFDGVDSSGQHPAASVPATQAKQVGAERTTKGKNEMDSRVPGPSSSRPQRSFLSRVIRAALPLQLLLLLLLLLACLLPSSEEDYSCTQANNFARSFYPMLRYTNGPPPT
ncbi:nesprin-2 isoform X1 [Elephas maximus indicus]|uniref:nesprin-2 isoform X1 n=1 Tax=Elephas maximus indicus TaxID=99487 RepID=UPI0021165CAB|nr:nesprin-2 isoform X1 [Elephas maximus indicus]XP_049755485.1 nesprin-2 isoform X1 [Elephas maximus indicus]XP_049755486.1 nesprin-2 isoform X1 [Elephas maximus indicus]